mmetsp:Transcript_45917/g.118809  ORF Transcript_45917/g.118809 Transcript_45917/m.118809 type:complete len:226 (-) Transcript_45917:131-808(-)
MVRDKGSGRRTTWDRAHHGRLYLDEAARVQILPDGVDDLCPHDEGFPDLVIDDQVQVSLAVARLLVLQPLVLLRQHVQAGRQQLQLAGEDRELTALGLPHDAAHPDDVPAVDCPVRLLEVVALVLLLGAHELDRVAVGGEVVEAQLVARGALALHPPGDADHRALRLFAVRQVPVLPDQLLHGGVDRPLVRVHLRELRQLLLPILEVSSRVHLLLHRRLGASLSL